MKNIYKQFQPIGKQWLLELNNYNEVPFKRKTSQVKWSLSDIYGHLCQSTLGFHLSGVKKCLEEPSNGNKTWAGKMVFLKNSFNNNKLKEFMATEFPPLESGDISVLKDKMIRVLKQMDELGKEINKGNKDQKAEHPVLGFLSIEEWYRLVIFHFEYHRKNKLKIDKFLTV